MFRTNDLDEPWELLNENEQVTVTKDGTVRAELYSFVRYMAVVCITGDKVAENSASMISNAFSAAKQALKVGSRIRLAGWEGVGSAPGQCGYLVHGPAPVALTCDGPRNARSISVVENQELAQQVAGAIRLQLCGRSPRQLTDELLQLEMPTCRRRARAVGILENYITSESDKTVLIRHIVDKCWGLSRDNPVE